MSFLNRLSFASPLESRDGTLARDSKMKNCVIENVDGQKLVVKRPGVANGSTIIGGGIAQGMTALNGVVYSVVSDQLYALPVSPWSGTGGGGGPVISGAGGGGSGWQLQTVKLPCNATRGDQFFVMGSSVVCLDFSANKAWISADLETWTEYPGFPLIFDVPDGLVYFSGYLWGYSSYANPPNNSSQVIRSADGSSWDQVDYSNPSPSNKFLMNFGSQKKVVHEGYVLAFDSTLGNYRLRKTNNFLTWTDAYLTNLDQSMVSFILSYNGDLYSIPSGSSGDKSVFKSTDGGFTWSLLVGEWGITSTGVASASATPLGILVVCNDGQTWVSADGATWIKKSYTVPSPKPGGFMTPFGTDIILLGGGGLSDLQECFQTARQRGARGETALIESRRGRTGQIVRYSPHQSGSSLRYLGAYLGAYFDLAKVKPINGKG